MSSRGLSPRVRGNPSPILFPKLLLGSIPACAGEPFSSVRPSRGYEVYPRVCGGTAMTWCGCGRPTGLSPRVRGNRHPRDRCAHLSRSIPACAGEPSTANRTPDPQAVYPRVCGGTHASNKKIGYDHGLSPRVRGNPSALEEANMANGSIPACAGEPHRCCRTGNNRRVYPRVCGGTAAGGTASTPNAGLSPRVRGNHILRLQERIPERSIPACAGEPSGVRVGDCLTKVYPRVCGGTGCACR